MYKDRVPIYIGRMKKAFIIMLVFIIIEALAAVLAFALDNSALGVYFSFFGPFTIGITLSFVWIYLGQWLAASRNRDPAIWGILFLFFGIWALLILVIMGEVKEDGTDNLTKTVNTFSATPKSETDTADALLKYKNLLDQGVITQEEFEKKKAELLNLIS